MELRHLQTFAAAAERESFTGAAKLLEVTQAAVSQQIAALESELGVKLFERAGRGVGLTVQGRKLHGYAQQILDLVEEAACQVGEAEHNVVGDLRIATSTVPSEWLLPELLAGFRAEWPNVRESLIVSDSREAAAAVEAGEADVGFVGELPRSAQLESRAVAEDKLVLFVATDHPLAVKGSTTLKQLGNEPLIVREPGSASRGCVERAMEEQGFSPEDFTVAMVVNNNDAIRCAVERGVGVAFLSEQANRHQTGISPVKVRGFHPHRQLYVICDPKRIHATPARQFLKFVEQWRSA